MPKLDLTQDEVTAVLEALDMYNKSAKRAQNTGRTPQIKEVWAAHQRTIMALTAKIGNAK